MAHVDSGVHGEQLERFKDALVELNVRAWQMRERMLAQTGQQSGLTLDEFTAHITAHPIRQHDHPDVADMLLAWVLGSEHPQHDQAAPVTSAPPDEQHQ